jgi:anti-sigma regulatory factor (Ser/Thr protein kinase)
VPKARRFTTTVLRHWSVPEDVRDTAELVVSELASNAVRHGCGDFLLRLSLEDKVLRIGATDCGAGPAVGGAEPESGLSERGRGMAIVECVSAWVRTRACEGGYTVEAGLTIGN